VVTLAGQVWSDELFCLTRSSLDPARKTGHYLEADMGWVAKTVGLWSAVSAACYWGMDRLRVDPVSLSPDFVQVRLSPSMA